MKKYHMVKHKLEIIDQKEIEKILKEGKYLTLSMCRGEEPYIVTLSYGFDSDKNEIFFHCAKRGLKLEFLSENTMVCGTIVKDLGYREGRCTHGFRSVVFWGEVSQIEELGKMKHAYKVMTDQLESNPQEVRERILKREFDYKRALLFKIKITDITGKASSNF